MLFGHADAGSPRERCAGCDYELRGLGSRVCPECGRDLDRPSGVVWATERELRTWRRLRVFSWCMCIAAAAPLLVMGAAVALHVVGRVAIGRWPAPHDYSDTSTLLGVLGSVTRSAMTPAAGTALLAYVIWTFVFIAGGSSQEVFELLARSRTVFRMVFAPVLLLLATLLVVCAGVGGGLWRSFVGGF